MGEASNPGPSEYVSASKITCVCLNSQGAPGVWKLYEENFFGSMVVLLQDLCMGQSEWNSFCALANRKQYHCYRTPGASTVGAWGETRHRGGVAFLIHKAVRHSLVGTMTSFNSQIMGMWIHGVHVVNMYAPPGQEQVCSQLFVDYSQAFRLGDRWAVAGDFNQEPEDSFYELLKLHGAVCCAPNVPTRWTGRRVVDWVASTLNTVQNVSLQTKVHLSDHLGFFFELLPTRNQLPDRELWRGRLKPAPRWSKPENIPTEDWQEALAKTWDDEITQLISFQQLMSQLRDEGARVGSPPRVFSQEDVQNQWDLYMECLRFCFKHTISRLLSEADEGPLKAQLTKLHRQPGFHAKGKSARFQWVSVPMSQAQDPKPGEKVRKLLRTLARCYEVLRLVQLGRRPNGSLLRRVFGHLGETWTENQIADRARGILSRVQTDLLQGQQQDKTARLASWKKRLNDPTLKGLGRWIRTKESGKPGVIVVDDTGPITHRTEVTAAICSFWQKVWQICAG